MFSLQWHTSYSHEQTLRIGSVLRSKTLWASKTLDFIGSDNYKERRRINANSASAERRSARARRPRACGRQDRAGERLRRSEGQAGRRGRPTHRKLTRLKTRCFCYTSSCTFIAFVLQIWLMWLLISRDGGKWWSKDHHLVVVKIIKNVDFSLKNVKKMVIKSYNIFL